MQFHYKAVQLHRMSFLSMPGIVMVGAGIKIKNRGFTGVPSVVFGVRKKLPMQQVPTDQRIPSLIDSLVTDVIELGKVRFMGYSLPSPPETEEDENALRKTRVRPAQPGVSIGHYKTTAGTFGAVVRGDFPDGMAILSNNHILANGTNGNDGRSRPGDPIYQPGPYDKGGPDDLIGRLHSFSPLIPESASRAPRYNVIDSALAIPVRPDIINSSILGLGKVSRTSAAMPGMPAFKSSRSSGISSGRIMATGATLRVDNEKDTYMFENQIGVSGVSQPGDSGSLVVSRFGTAVGILFAGSDNHYFANPIDLVLKNYGVTLA